MDQAKIEKLLEEMNLLLRAGMIKFWQRHKDLSVDKIDQLYRTVIERESRRH